MITPKRWLELDLSSAMSNLNILGYELDKQGKIGITLTDKKGSTISLLKTGVAVFQVPPRRESSNIRDEAIAIYKKLLVDKLKVPKEALPLDKTFM